MRCFIALRTDGSEREALAAWLARARETGLLAVTPAENLHVTLAFLGEIDAGGVEAARQAVRRGAEAAGPGLALTWAAPGVFPARSRPRVLWLGVSDGDRQLAAMHQAVAGGLSAAGLATEARAFRPHLTLARVRPTRSDAERLFQLLAEAPVPAPSRVMAVGLFESHLGGGPARHECVFEARLGEWRARHDLNARPSDP